MFEESGKQRKIRVGRAVASTFLGPPPTSEHTVDHIDRDPENDTLENIRWLCRYGQRVNQVRPETYKDTFIVVKGGVEKTAKEWVDLLKDEKNSFGRDYTDNMIKHYARKKQYGFEYKEYQDLPGEVWKKITNSDNRIGRWEISNMNRVKYITNHAENVIYGECLGLMSGYPTISINGKQWHCHILSFMTFFPHDWADKKPDEIVLHEDDDRLDFRPHKLRIGTFSQNGIDAHDNSKYDGKKSARIKCASYINGILEKEHESLTAAMTYLKSQGIERASYQSISQALGGKQRTAYSRIWKHIDALII